MRLPRVQVFLIVVMQDKLEELDELSLRPGRDNGSGEDIFPRARNANQRRFFPRRRRGRSKSVEGSDRLELELPVCS